MGWDQFAYFEVLHALSILKQNLSNYYQYQLYFMLSISNCLITAPVYERVFTRSVYQPLVYAFGAPTTRLRVWCTPEALTNQGETH